ncbi:MAG: GxxExxY protein [Acidobacteriia bacterium]|nr:GxxExxY protein [Terriglobia bacterium]
MQVNHISRLIVTAAMRVHSVLGAGLLESAYQACLAHELRKQGLNVQTEVALPVVYEGIRLDVGYRVDVLVEGCIIVELKTVEKLLPVHEAQLLSHLKVSGMHLGLLINFKVPHLKDGIKRLVNNF